MFLTNANNEFEKRSDLENEEFVSLVSNCIINWLVN